MDRDIAALPFSQHGTTDYNETDPFCVFDLDQVCRVEQTHGRSSCEQENTLAVNLTTAKALGRAWQSNDAVLLRCRSALQAEYN
jgi:hypothetical protein